MKKTGWLKIKLKLLLRKREGIVEYNLSGSGWQDYYTSSERDAMYSDAEDTRRRIADVEYEICCVARELMEAGYTREQLITGFKGLGKYLPKEEEKTEEETVEETTTMHM